MAYSSKVFHRYGSQGWGTSTIRIDRRHCSRATHRGPDHSSGRVRLRRTGILLCFVLRAVACLVSSTLKIPSRAIRNSSTGAFSPVFPPFGRLNTVAPAEALLPAPSLRAFPRPFGGAILTLPRQHGPCLRSLRLLGYGRAEQEAQVVGRAQCRSRFSAVGGNASRSR